MNQIKGRLIEILETKTGQGAKGVWTKTDMLLETEGQYPKKVKIECWGNDAMAIKEIEMGTSLYIDIDFESKEYQGKYYTSIKSTKITRA